MKCKIPQMSKIGMLIIFLVILPAFFAGCASKNDVKQKIVDIDQIVKDATKAPPQPKLITEISTSEDSESISVFIKGNRLLTYTSVKQPSPPAVLLYFPETALRSDIKKIYTPESNTIGLIKTSELSGKGTTSRIEITLLKDTPHNVTREDLGLKVSFQKARMLSSAGLKTGLEDIDDTKENTADEPGINSSEKSGLKAARLQSIYATQLDDSVKITIKADGSIRDYRSFPVNNPARIVFDIFNLTSPYKKEQLVPVNTEWVKQVRYYSYPDRVRVVLDTKDSYLSSYSASPVETGLVVYVGKDEKTVVTSSQKERHTDVEEIIQTETEDRLPESAWVKRIDFLSEEAGKSTVIIGTTKPIEYKIKKPSDKRLLLRMFNTRLPGYRQRPLITTRFESAVDRITPVQTKAMKDEANILIELREAVPYFVEQKDNLLLIHFEASGIPSKPMEKADLPPWKQVLAQTIDVAEEEVKEEAGESASYPSAAGKYSGEKIALDFFETDIKNVFRILRKISGKNFAIDKDVTGKVTLSLDKPVPWDQVLDLILKMNQLDKTSEGNIVRIATIATLKKEETDRRAAVIEEQKAKEEKMALEPLVTEYIPVSYSNASKEIMPHLEKIITKERGSISVDERSNLIIITDVAEKIKQAKAIVQALDTVTPQVIIEARIVEASTNFSREIGTEWGMAGGIQSTAANAGIGPQRGYDTLGGTYGYDAAVNFPGNISNTLSGTMGFNFTRIAGTPFLLDVRLRAMESRGEGKIISAPRIVTLDNKKATIKQGLEFPYLERDDAGGATVKFKDIDLLLEVTPHVTPDDRISMILHITKNDIGEVINDVQSFTTKEAQTELLINDGETVVIGGIIKTVKTTGESGLPGFSKIPILGWLFKNKSNSSRKEELLIFITPRIVKLPQRELL